MDQDIEKIKAIIAEKSKRYQSKMGEVTFAGIEGGNVKIAPLGFCWRSRSLIASAWRAVARMDATC